MTVSNYLWGFGILGLTLSLNKGSWGGERLNGRKSGIFSRISSALEAAFLWIGRQTSKNKWISHAGL